jgi:hypothetical protein
MDDGMYIYNNGKGWAVFKTRPPGSGNHFAYLEPSGDWSLVVATYYETKEEANVVLQQIRNRQAEEESWNRRMKGAKDE